MFHIVAIVIVSTITGTHVFTSNETYPTKDACQSALSTRLTELHTSVAGQYPDAKVEIGGECTELPGQPA